jgi:hypothetical protein
MRDSQGKAADIPGQKFGSRLISISPRTVVRAGGKGAGAVGFAARGGVDDCDVAPLPGRSRCPDSEFAALGSGLGEGALLLMMADVWSGTETLMAALAALGSTLDPLSFTNSAIKVIAATRASTRNHLNLPNPARERYLA